VWAAWIEEFRPEKERERKEGVDCVESVDSTESMSDESENDKKMHTERQ
jgi:hypothetical protein